MKSFLRGLGFLALSLIVGELVKRLLSSRVGSATAHRLGRPELATIEGAASVSKEARKAVGLVKSLTGSPRPIKETVLSIERAPGWVGMARDASEMLLSAGALLRVAAEFVGEDGKLQKKVARGSANTG